LNDSQPAKTTRSKEERVGIGDVETGKYKER